ncbi:hypothetical protein DENSPDRAFT_834563 [Dentipellis sp. KUC8613]|nr:hypothetical protein DENSPDRAFT_834563 [Dentipellis sp. KUC8613]
MLHQSGMPVSIGHTAFSAPRQATLISPTSELFSSFPIPAHPPTHIHVAMERTHLLALTSTQALSSIPRVAPTKCVPNSPSWPPSRLVYHRGWDNILPPSPKLHILSFSASLRSSLSRGRSHLGLWPLSIRHADAQRVRFAVRTYTHARSGRPA